MQYKRATIDRIRMSIYYIRQDIELYNHLMNEQILTDTVIKLKEINKELNKIKL